jgi:hypothetical protein
MCSAYRSIAFPPRLVVMVTSGEDYEGSFSEKLIITPLAEKFPAFMEPDVS